MSRVSTHLKDLKVGDLIWTDVIINVKDLADPNSKTKTTKAIKAGKAVRRICVVLVPGHASVEVTYLATFHESHTLPHGLDKAMWYPFHPATKEEHLDPLPELKDKKAQWASLRSKHTVTHDPVEKLSEVLPVTSVDHIKAHMK